MKTRHSKRTSAETKLIRKVQEQLTADRRNREQAQQTVDRFNAVRRRASRPFKQEMYDKFMRAAGIDMAEVRKRQAIDAESVKKFVSTQSRTATADARKIRDRQTILFERRAKQFKHTSDTGIPVLMRFPNWPLRPPLPIVFQTIEEAVSIHSTWVDDGSETSIAPQQNLAWPEDFSASSGRLGSKTNRAYVDWQFLWTPPRDGYLNAISYISFNAYLKLWCFNNCFNSESSAAMWNGMTLSQISNDGSVNSETVPLAPFGEWDVAESGDSTGPSLIRGENAENQMIYNQMMPIQGKTPLLITVSAELGVWAENGHAEIMFNNEPYNMNVPLVSLILF
jgi:hypothetical protein